MFVAKTYVLFYRGYDYDRGMGGGGRGGGPVSLGLLPLLRLHFTCCYVHITNMRLFKPSMQRQADLYMCSV